MSFLFINELRGNHMFKKSCFLVALLILGCNTTNSESEIPLLEVNYEFNQINGYPDYIEAYSQTEIDAFIATLPDQLAWYTEISKFGDFNFNFRDYEYLEDLDPLSNADSIRMELESVLYEFSEFTNVVDTSLIYFREFSNSEDSTLWSLSTYEQETNAGATLPFTGYQVGLSSKGILNIQGVWYGKDIFIPNFQFEPQLSAIEAINLDSGKKINHVCDYEVGLSESHLRNITSEIITYDLSDKRVFLIAWNLDFYGANVYIDKVSSQVISIGTTGICF